MALRIPQMPGVPPAVMAKGVIPFVIASAALTGGLERWEGNILKVYPDTLANGLPTFCAGRTDWQAPVGTVLSESTCKQINKVTLVEYTYAVLACTEWKNLTQKRLDALVLFAVNVGKAGACNSQAVKAINAGRIQEGCNFIAYRTDWTPNWSYVEQTFIKGLHNRRLFERQWCLEGLV
jgi:lysozyme